MISLVDTYERLIATGEATRYATTHSTIASILQASTCPVSHQELVTAVSGHGGNPYTPDQLVDSVIEHEMKGAMAVLLVAGYPIQTPLAKAVVLSAFARTNRMNIEKLKELGHADLLVRIQSAERSWKRTYTHLYRSAPTQLCDQLDSLLGGCAIHRVIEALDLDPNVKTA
ncbi:MULTISPECIES: hypothetical protein [unclassified Exiguobacterium]|uniref:hypothetical protein n=1 Tax=unclassified Exiguobacterium TaxID=2644629 RepID=UPI001BE7A210|nr:MULTISPECIES: hypothetical protein [unclassified Exiguobacterium]